MLTSRSLTLAWLSVCTLLTSARAQSPPKLTARELFYNPVSQDVPAKPDKAKQPKRTAALRPPPAKASNSASVAEPNQRASTQIAPGSAGELPLVPATYQKLKPLGLRYGFLLRRAGQEFEEVDAGSVFHAGDSIRVSVATNDAAYLYIVMRGTSGTWKLLFPTNEIGGGANRVESGRSYVFPPPPGRFTFDERKGEEKICLVLSRQPEPSLEQLIYALSSAHPPARQDADKPLQPMLLSQSRPINDGLVDQLRNRVMARDLIFETVDENTPGEKKEKAAYVVNTNASPDARLVVDLILRHE